MQNNLFCIITQHRSLLFLLKGRRLYYFFFQNKHRTKQNYFVKQQKSSSTALEQIIFFSCKLVWQFFNCMVILDQKSQIKHNSFEGKKTKISDKSFKQKIKQEQSNTFQYRFATAVQSRNQGEILVSLHHFPDTQKKSPSHDRSPATEIKFTYNLYLN